MKHIPMREVKRVEWEVDDEFAAELAEAREPVILTNTMVTQWKAIKEWIKPYYLPNHPALAKMNGCRVSQASTFAYADKKSAMSKSAALQGKIKTESNYEEYNSTGPEFFSKLMNPDNENFYYWYGKVEGDLRNDLNPSKNLWVDPDSQKAYGLYMWLSEGEVGPNLHYDQDHNFFVQINGTKRFVLFPPWEWRALYPYPRTHPAWHKSQVEFDEPNLETMPNFANTRAYIAKLQPGDVLYVPPYWWHHVRSKGLSVSLASWSNSKVFQRLKEVYETELQIDTFSDPEERKAAVAVFIEKLFSEAFSVTARRVMKSGLTARFGPLENVFKEFESWEDPEFCSFRKKYPAKHFGNVFKEDLENALVAFSTCQGDDVSIERKDMQAIREIEIFEFMETIVADAVGAENSYAFMKRCLFKSKNDDE
jgi:hypothetical protein